MSSSRHGNIQGFIANGICAVFRKNEPRNLNNRTRDGRRMIGGPDGHMEPLEWAKFVIRNKTEEDYPAALSVISSRAAQGDSDAEFYLGLVYARGQGIDRDFRLAREWMQRSESQGNSNAAYFLGKIYLRGYGLENPIPSEAAKLFEKAADSGDIRAMYELALLFMNGNGVARDLSKTYNLLLDSANGGHLEAQFVLGQLYKTGAGTDRDPSQAVRWLSAAAMHGHKGAQILLGDMYAMGDGVDKDVDEANRWYDMADGKVSH